jgi:hypothetical protein
MSDTFDLPRDADGFLDMDAFPDDDLDPVAADELDGTLQDASELDDFDDRWDTLVDRAVDPDAEAVPEDLVGPSDPSYEDAPFAEVDDGDVVNPFADAEDEPAFEDDASDEPLAADDDADLDEPDLDTPDLDHDEGDVFGAGDDGHSLFDDTEPPLDDDLDLTDDVTEPPVDDIDGLDALDSHLRDHGS